MFLPIGFAALIHHSDFAPLHENQFQPSHRLQSKAKHLPFAQCLSSSMFILLHLWLQWDPATHGCPVAWPVLGKEGRREGGKGNNEATPPILTPPLSLSPFNLPFAFPLIFPLAGCVCVLICLCFVSHGESTCIPSLPYSTSILCCHHTPDPNVILYSCILS